MRLPCISHRKEKGCVLNMFHRLRLGIRRVLVCALALVIVACTSIQTSSPPATEVISTCCTPVSVSATTLASTPSAEPVTSIVALTSTALACRFEHPPKLPSSQFAEWCNSGCPLRQDQFMVITSSENARRCNGVFPRDSFTLSFTFPTWWMVHPVGAFGQNLLFETDKGQETLLVLETNTGLPLERADESEYYFAPGYSSYLVSPEEPRISKELQTISDKEVLVLETADGDSFIRRYFVIHDNTLYMFKIEIPKLRFDDEETTELFLQVEEIISSIQFVP